MIRTPSVIISLLSLLPMLATAQDHISLTPSNCYQQDSHCQLDISIDWHFQEETSFCIEPQYMSAPVLCFESSKKGQLTIPVRFSETTEFLLVNMETNQVIDTLTLRVMTQALLKRKRKRHVWSVIL